MQNWHAHCNSIGMDVRNWRLKLIRFLDTNPFKLARNLVINWRGPMRDTRCLDAQARKGDLRYIKGSI